MALLRSKALHHGRSLSFPSGSHSSTSQLQDNLLRIRSSEARCSSLSSINDKFNVLQNLYVNIDGFLVSTHINSQELQENQILDSYIRLLDACSSVEDLVSQTKHQVQDLSSALRRKDANGIQSYLTSRRRTKKMIEKSLKNLKSSRTKIISALEKDDESSSIIFMLKEAEKVTFSILESLLSYMMGSKGQSLISKLMSSKKIGVEKELNEFEKTDAMLQTSQVEDLMNHLKGMDSNIQVLEQELECLFRQLIKTRVSLLNGLNH